MRSAWGAVWAGRASCRPGFGLPGPGDAVTGGRPVTSSEASVPAGAAKAGGTASTGLFLRRTWGLGRELGIPAATAISLASVAVVNTFINFNAGLTDFTKSDMYLPLVAGAVIWLVAMFAHPSLL